MLFGSRYKKVLGTIFHCHDHEASGEPDYGRRGGMPLPFPGSRPAPGGPVRRTWPRTSGRRRAPHARERAGAALFKAGEARCEELSPAIAPATTPATTPTTTPTTTRRMKGSPHKQWSGVWVFVIFLNKNYIFCLTKSETPKHPRPFCVEIPSYGG